MLERVDKAESVRNYYRQQGKATERERIIKLLNETVNDYLSDKLWVEAEVIATVMRKLIEGDK